MRSGLSLGSGNLKESHFRQEWISHSFCLCKWIPETHERHPKITTASKAAHKCRGNWSAPLRVDNASFYCDPIEVFTVQ